MADTSQKTEKPTPRKLKKARKEGQIPRSAEVGSWLALLVVVFVLHLTMSSGINLSRELMAQIPEVVRQPDPGSCLHLLSEGLIGGAKVLAPLVLGILVTGVVAAAAQGGIRPSTKVLKPQMKRLNPLSGFKRVFGPKGGWEAAKALGKTGILGLLLYQTIMSVVPMARTSTVVPLETVLHVTGDAIMTFARNAAITGLILAAFDYAMQVRRVRKELKMSRQEVKDEFRNTEGDPHVKGAIRSRQMAMRRNRMIADIAEADVVLVNPTHVAVALRYDASRGAPRVVAKGAGAIAARIRQAAAEHRIPMVEDVPLARTLYRVCDLGQEIPAELYAAVARVLAFIFSLKRKGSAVGLHHRPPTTEQELAAVPTRRRRARKRPRRPKVPQLAR